MLVNSDLSEDVVYDMLTVIFDNISTIKASHNAANKHIDLSFGVEDVKIPLHPGAVKFWQEKGFKTPQN